MDNEEFDLEAIGSYEIQPERATKSRYALAGLSFLAEVSQAVTNFMGMITVVTAAHVMQQKIDDEFGRITGDFSNTIGLGTGTTQSED